MPDPLTATEKFALAGALHSKEAAERVSAAVASEDGGGGGAGVGGPVNTAIATAGAGTLTAAGIIGGVITRTGPTAAFSDTTATAQQLHDTVPVYVAAMSWTLYIKNTVAFNGTLVGGTGVTLSGNTIIPPNSIGQFLVTLTGVTTATVVGMGSSPITTKPLLQNAAITTAGAGVLTAAGLVGGVITRSGPTAAFTDTTALATAIIAAMPNANIGQSFEVQVKNMVAFAGTVTGDTGVTVSGIALIPPLSVGVFLVTYTAAATITMVGLGSFPLCNMPPAHYTTIATDTTITAAAGTLTGANHNVYRTTAAGAGGIALTTRTAAQMFSDIPNAQVGMEFFTTIVSQGGGTVTLTDGGQVTITGTATVATKTTRTFACKFTTSAALTMVSISTGTIE